MITEEERQRRQRESAVEQRVPTLHELEDAVDAKRRNKVIGMLAIVLTAAVLAIAFGPSAQAATLDFAIQSTPSTFVDPQNNVTGPMDPALISGYHWCIDRQASPDPALCGQGSNIIVFVDVTADVFQTVFTGIEFELPPGSPPVEDGQTFFVCGMTELVTGELSPVWGNCVGKPANMTPTPPPPPGPTGLPAAVELEPGSIIIRFRADECITVAPCEAN